MATKKKGPTPKRRVQHPQPRKRKTRARAFLLVWVVAVLAAPVVGAVAVVMARDDESATSSDRAPDDAGPVHVHGLGINPADGSLLIATHTGMYRVEPNERKAERVGESRQDTMGFTVAGPHYFLGSGHPDVGEAIERDLPPHLGLIESRDAGRSWRPVSLSGEADFHVLRFAGERVYGYDASNDRLLVSGDRGRRWREMTRPAPLLDLAVDPTDPKRIVAAGEGGLYASRNGGRNWHRIAERVGFLGWPASRRLFLVDGTGSVLTSADSGRRWTNVGSVGGEPSALLAQTQRDLYTALHDGTIKQSRDGGRTWTIRSVP